MNTLESIVPDRERCLALKEAGFPQDGPLAWYGPKDLGGATLPATVIPYGTGEGREYLCAAPTLSELVGELPDRLLGTGEDGDAHGAFWLQADKYDPLGLASVPGMWHRFYYEDHDRRTLYLGGLDDHAVRDGPHAANAAADLYLALHAAGLIGDSTAPEAQTAHPEYASYIDPDSTPPEASGDTPE